jgi:hypothetical protein
MTTRLAHEKSGDVKWNQKRKSLIGSDNKRLKGLLKQLKAKLYPEYTYKAATKGPTVKLPKGTRKLKCGKAVGNRFDKAVDESIRIIRKYGFDPEVFWVRTMHTQALKRSSLLKTHRLQMKQIFKANTTKTNRSTPYVKYFWQTMAKLQLMPMDTQVEVRHKTLNVSSLIDVVVKGKGRKRHCIELKTGHDSYLDKHTGHNMKAPFSDQTDSCRNQHQLQVSASSAMYFQTHLLPLEERGEPLILLFQSTGVKVITREEWAKPELIFKALA